MKNVTNHEIRSLKLVENKLPVYTTDFFFV